MTVRVYYSTDPGAPTLSGTAGAAIAVLYACLVTGYGSKASAGWTQEYSGTNLAAFRSAAGNRHYLWVDDTATTAFRVRGFESMSAIDTGVGPFPTDAQMSGGCYCSKSQAANSDARGWIVVADEKRFWFLAAHGTATIAGSTYNGNGMFFGDILSMKAGDAFGTLLMASNTASSGNNFVGGLAVSSTVAVTAHYMPRAYTQIGGAVAVGKHSDYPKSYGATIVGAGGGAYPDPVTGGIWLAPLFVHEGGLTRGIIPGGWNPLHNMPAQPGDTFQGAGPLAGREFIFVDTASSASRGRIALEISDTWE